MTLPGKVGHFFQTFLTGPGNAVLLIGYVYAAGFAFVRYRPWRRPEGHAWVLLVALFPFLYAGVAGPSPTQYQYLYMLLPFMTLTLFAALARERDDPAALARWRWWALAGLGLALGPRLPRGDWPVGRPPFAAQSGPPARAGCGRLGGGRAGRGGRGAGTRGPLGCGGGGAARPPPKGPRGGRFSKERFGATDRCGGGETPPCPPLRQTPSSPRQRATV